jgi:hypothetical protein
MLNRKARCPRERTFQRLAALRHWRPFARGTFLVEVKRESLAAAGGAVTATMRSGHVDERQSRPRGQACRNTRLELTCRLVFGRMFLCEGLGIGHEQHDDPREEKERAAHSKGQLEADHLGKATKEDRRKGGNATTDVEAEACTRRPNAGRIQLAEIRPEQPDPGDEERSTGPSHNRTVRSVASAYIGRVTAQPNRVMSRACRLPMVSASQPNSW